MKMMQGACFLPCSKRSRTREAPTPTNISTKSEPEIEKKGTLASPAMALARRVLPVPGGPTRSTPLGILPPSFWNLGGSFRNSMISRSSSLASSTPAMHLAHEEDPDADEEEHGHPLQHVGIPGIAVFGLDGDLDTLVAEQFDEFGVVGGEGPEGAAVSKLTRDGFAADEHFLDLARLHTLEEVGEDHLAAGGLAGLEHIEEDKNDEADDHPEGEVLVERGIHRVCEYSTRAHASAGGGRRAFSPPRGRESPVVPGSSRPGRSHSRPQSGPG